MASNLTHVKFCEITLDNRTPSEPYRYFLSLADVELPAHPQDKRTPPYLHPLQRDRLPPPDPLVTGGRK
jgi:hypothetical protein